MEDHSKLHNKPSTQKGYQYQIYRFIVPAFGSKKTHEVTRQVITALMKRLEKSPTQANHVLACVRKMFNLAELWGYRPDGSNPCRHVPKYPEKDSTRLITDEQMIKLFAYLDKAEAEGLEHPTYLLAIRLQFEFAARMSEILLLQWDWIDLSNDRVVWPDSKTGDISKSLSAEVRRLRRVTGCGLARSATRSGGILGAGFGAGTPGVVSSLMPRASSPPLPFPRTIRRRELHQISLAESTIDEMEKRGEFPQRLRLTARCVVWDMDEVEAWVEARKEASRSGDETATPGPDVKPVRPTHAHRRS